MNDWIFVLILAGLLLSAAIGSWALGRFGSSGSSGGGGLGSL